MGSHICGTGTQLERSFPVRTAAGIIKINKKIEGRFFKSVGINSLVTFYILPNLNSFDGIIGDDTLKELGAIINRENNTLTIRPGIVLTLKERFTQEINFINVNVPPEIKEKLKKLLKKYSDLFSPLEAGEMVTTAIKAEIKTSTDEPIYTKSYPYPANMRPVVEEQISELLNQNIIRISNSPYNSPVWVVPKKPKPNGEKQYRMVIDFKRLNSVTISDTYPIPDINSTLASLGKAKYFTTLDLTSGFHQIPMKDSDIPKTAFSTLNGKYEFLRLPFGLKNAPSIFQRMIDDVLKEYIGKICYVYIDDIIVFGRDVDDHLKNIETIFSKLLESHLKVNLEKTQFLQTEVSFLGYVVAEGGIRADPHKIEAIQNLAPPKTLKDLKSFLGMTSYYRKFIRDYAKIAKPLTNLTRGENAQVKANASKKVTVDLAEDALRAFNELKTLLMSSEVLAFPDFDQPFNLTTDASNYAIGAVLSQDFTGTDRPIAFISRSLKKAEENYATNEKEMLAIVWALDNLRSYLYGAKKVKIYTDHQPLTYAFGNQNHNAKLKRWKARIEEYNYELVYKPGKSNVVADALSRLEANRNQIYMLTDEGTITASETGSETVTADEGKSEQSDNTVHSAQQDSSDLIHHVEVPLNVFKNQIIIREGKELHSNMQPHPGFTRHHATLEQITSQRLTEILKKCLNPNCINGVKIPECFIPLLNSIYLAHFISYKIRITQRLVEDVTNEERVCRIIEDEHKRAHRNAKENSLQILERYYFPRMRSLICQYTRNCEVCKLNKYDRHPYKPKLQATPIPKYSCEILHIDIFEIQGFKFISCIDKFSKFAKLFHIKNRSAIHLKSKLTKVLHYFTVPRMVVLDNEKGFLTPTILNFIRSLNIEIYFTPVQRSEVNGQIERFHSTLIEIYRCLSRETKNMGTKDMINLAVDRYNNTIHSVTRRKPSDVFFNRSERFNYQNLVNFRDQVNQDIRGLIEHNQKATNDRLNKTRSDPANLAEGAEVIIRNKQIKPKHKALYRKHEVSDNNRVTLKTTTGKKFHKAHVKNLK